jgi:hypothetical protein
MQRILRVCVALIYEFRVSIIKSVRSDFDNIKFPKSEYLRKISQVLKELELL